MAYFCYLYYMFTGFYIFQIVRNNKILHSQDWLLIALILVIFYNVITLTFMKNKKLIGIFLCYSLIVLYYKWPICNFIYNFFSEPMIYIQKLFSINFIVFLILSFSYGRFIYRVKMAKNKQNKENEKSLFKEREKDKEYIKDFLMNNEEQNVLGIDDQFGEGKTFLVNEVIKSLDRNKFEIIKIRCLLLDADNVYPYIIKQLNRVLVNNFVFSGHIDRLKSGILKGLESKVLIGLSDVFVRESSVDDIENFKEAISNLNKTIVLIFDDLDRSSDEIKLEKLFSFISDFSQGNVKSLVLFNSNNLKLINEKFNRAYIEKYIPLTITMTKIPFKKLVLLEIKKNALNEKDFEFLFSILLNEKAENHKEKNLENKIEIEKMLNVEIEIEKLEYSPRKIEKFICETGKFLKEKYLGIEENTIVAFFFLKYFYYDEFYQKIEENGNIFKFFLSSLRLNKIDKVLTLEEYLFLISLIKKNKKEKIKEWEYSLLKLDIFLIKLGLETKRKNTFASKEKEAIEILENCFNENRIIVEDKLELLFYILLNYRVFFNEDDSIESFKIKENNESIEKAIKKLKFIGKVEYLSSYRKCYEKLKLYLAKKEQKESYINLLEKYYPAAKNNEKKLNGETYEEKTMNILNIFEDNENKIEYLNLIYCEDGNKITDRYLSTFFISNLKKVEISDFIIEEFLNGNFDISNRNTINEIFNNIGNLLMRERCRMNDLEVFKSLFNLTNIDYYGDFINNIKEKYKENKEYDYLIENSPTIKEWVRKEIEFLELLIKLEENEKITYYPANQNNNEREEDKLSEDLEKIKNIKDKAEQLKEIERLFIEGKDLDYLKYYEED